MADENGEAGVVVTPGPITERQRRNFDRLLAAVQTEALILIQCRDLKTNETVAVAARIIPPTIIGGSIGIEPLARVFSDEGVDEVAPVGADFGRDYGIGGRKLNG